MSKAVGFEAEEWAAKFLMEHGFRIVERNFSAKVGEIDIIALKDGVLHFVEVKYSKKHNAHERITPGKLAKLYRTIDYYLQKKALDLPYQLDAIIIEGEKLNYLQNITL